MRSSHIQIAVQKAGEIVYVSTSKADAQEYMNLSRPSLDRMLKEGCEIQGFTADISITNSFVPDKVTQAIQSTVAQYKRELQHAQRKFEVAQKAKLNADKELGEASEILDRKNKQLNKYMLDFGYKLQQ